MFCPKCLSDKITQVSSETVEYDCKAGEIISISFDSPHQEYKCRKCGEIFSSKKAKEITVQIESVWEYLCKKHNWSDENKDYMAVLLKSINNREEWNDLFHAIWKEKLNEGYIEWEWVAIYSGAIYDATSKGATQFIENESNPMEWISFNKVRWTPSWQWVNTQ